MIILSPPLSWTQSLRSSSPAHTSSRMTPAKTLPRMKHLLIWTNIAQTMMLKRDSKTSWLTILTRLWSQSSTKVSFMLFWKTFRTSMMNLAEKLKPLKNQCNLTMTTLMMRSFKKSKVTRKQKNLTLCHPQPQVRASLWTFSAILRSFSSSVTRSSTTPPFSSPS